MKKYSRKFFKIIGYKLQNQRGDEYHTEIIGNVLKAFMRHISMLLASLLLVLIILVFVLYKDHNIVKRWFWASNLNLHFYLQNFNDFNFFDCRSKNVSRWITYDTKFENCLIEKQIQKLKKFHGKNACQNRVSVSSQLWIRTIELCVLDIGTTAKTLNQKTK